jgi:hypothetical protein
VGFRRGEAWPYKATPGELGDRIAYQQAYGRDAYSFWQPLDVRFIHAIAQDAARRGVRYVSFFWSGFFSSCLEFPGPRGSSSMVDLYRQLDQAQFDALQQGAFSSTGQAYQAFLTGAGMP